MKGRGDLFFLGRASPFLSKNIGSADLAGATLFLSSKYPLRIEETEDADSVIPPSPPPRAFLLKGLTPYEDPRSATMRFSLPMVERSLRCAAASTSDLI